MNIYVMSRKAVYRLLLEKEMDVFKDNYVISISSSNSESLFSSVKELAKRKNILKVKFDDIAYYPNKWAMAALYDWVKNGRYRFMTDEQAADIAEFLKKIKPEEGKGLIIHCDAGISRSGAVSLVADKLLNTTKEEHMHYRLTNSHIQPNDYVYAKLADILLGEPYIESEQYRLEQKFKKIGATEGET